MGFVEVDNKAEKLSIKHIKDTIEQLGCTKNMAYGVGVIPLRDTILILN